MTMEDLIKATDRRKKRRFAVRREVRYKLLAENVIVDSGAGQTANVSSGSIAFSVDHELKAGSFIELSMSWPALLDFSCPMRMVVFGRVLRSTDRLAVCTIDKHEFRTQARTFQAAGVMRNDTMLQRWAVEVTKESMKPRAVHA
jgi:hypothetical protein